MILIVFVLLGWFESANAWAPGKPFRRNRLEFKRLSVALPFSAKRTDDNEVFPLQEKKIALSPSEVSRKLFETDKRPIILFDGVCNLCNNAVNLALDWDPQGNLRFSALQSQVGRSLLQRHGRKADDISSIVLVNEEDAYIKSDAILKIAEALSPVPFLPTRQVAQLAQFIVPSFVRDIVYNQVADNRYQIMGKRNECRFDADGEFEDRFIDDELAFSK